MRYRSQEDPLIHDDTATPFVLHEVDAPNANKGSSGASGSSSSKVKSAYDLAAELGIDASTVRANEGEAAMHGIYYDDTTYDYMQHMRDIGGSAGEAIFIDAAQAGSKQRKDKKKHNKQSLDQAIMMEVEPKSKVVLIPKELLPSENLVKRTYQDMQDIPDAIAGFQPDMDPRLREVLEALEDEAYVDDDEDIFAQLAEGGEADEEDFLDQDFEDEDDDGWQSDTTEKAVVLPSTALSTATATATTAEAAAATAEPPVEGEPAAEGNADWMREFSKYKKAQKKEKGTKADDDAASSLADTMSFGGSSAMTAGTVSVSGRRRRRREKKNGGAKTATSGYSMSSSALFRTEGLTLLDDRFDRVCPPPPPPFSFSPVTNSLAPCRLRRNTTTTPQTQARTRKSAGMDPSPRRAGTLTRSWMSSWEGIP